MLNQAQNTALVAGPFRPEMAIPGRPTWRSDLRSDIAANDFSRELYSGPESVFQTILPRAARASSTFFRSYNYLGEALLNLKIVERLKAVHACNGV